MIIGIDMDDVLAQLTDTLRIWHNEKYGPVLRLEDHKEYELTKMWGCSSEERLRRLEEFFSSDQFRGIKPIAGSVDAIKKLSENHVLHVITSRHDGLKKETWEFVDKYFPGMFKEVHLTGQITHDAQKTTKADVCEEIGVQLMIEDGLHYAEACANRGAKVLLFDMPWNRTENLPSGVIRVRNWEEVLDHV